MSSDKPRRIFLVDCNNFFVSCERLFDPALIGKPVVVLSNNDGCVIARSNEAKALAIPMGAPAFQYAQLFKKHNVHIFSSNFCLYGDMSMRVMQTLSHESTDIEVYSVDEAFLHVPDFGLKQNADYFAARAQLMVRKVKQHTGIPISIGIAPTKTLAKIANKLAKKNPVYGGYFDITDRDDIDAILELVPVGDIWGVGRRYAKMLIANHIKTAKDLKYASDAWVRKKMSIIGLKMVHELRGIPCFAIDETVEPNKSFVVSRSFGNPVTDKKYLYQAAATHASSGGRKLRKQRLITGHVSAFVIIRQYGQEFRYYESASVTLSKATSYTPDLISAAKVCIDKIYKPGLIYKKVGIMLNDIVAADAQQMNIYEHNGHTNKQDNAMYAFDKVTTKWGTEKLTFAATGTEHETKPWLVKKEKRSKCFTTSWHELLTIDLDDKSK